MLLVAKGRLQRSRNRASAAAFAATGDPTAFRR